MAMMLQIPIVALQRSKVVRGKDLFNVSEGFLFSPISFTSLFSFPLKAWKVC